MTLGITGPSYFKTPNGISVPGFVYVDPNGLLAVPTTEFTMSSPGGVLMPKPVDASGHPLMALSGSSTQQYEQLSVTSGTVVNLTAAKYGTCTHAQILVENASIRFTNDGKTTPTASVGVLASANDVIELDTLADIQNFAMIAVSSTATIDAEYSV